MPEPLVVIYDGDCSLCQKAKERMEAIDFTHRLRFVALQDPEVLAQFPTLTRMDLIRTMHAVLPQGQVYTGAKAYQEIGKRISPRSPLGLFLRLFAALTRLPGALWVAEQVYQRVANNRYRLTFGHRAQCSIPAHPEEEPK